jgi:hypothetical protein
MSPRDDDDDPVDIEFPFFRFHVGGSGNRVRFGEEDEEEAIDMERSQSADYWAVRRRVRRRLRFVRHLFTYVVLTGLFVLLDWRTGGNGNGINWSQWVAIIWGIFLGWEFISTFLAPVLWGREMEERLIQRELRRQRGG